MLQKGFVYLLIPLIIIIAMGLVAVGYFVGNKNSLPQSVKNLPIISQITNKISGSNSYPIVDTGQKSCYNDSAGVSCPAEGGSFFGQDAQYITNAPQYKDNGDGTVSDLVTGLMWVKSVGDKKTYSQAVSGAKSFSLAGYNDWRVPTIKELYSLMNFEGFDPSSMDANPSTLTPFIDTNYFDFEYGDTSKGDRIIDSQWVTSNKYVSTVFNNQECFFGVNFADGRIKCYPSADMGHNNGYFVRYVRGPAYGVNNFSDTGNGAIFDQATGLTWQKIDSGKGMIWEDALRYCEDLNLAGKSDWRLPDAKELQSIVDYTRSPNTTDSPALDPIFQSTSITNEVGQKDWPFYWTSTTHLNQTGSQFAVYIAFGRALGKMNGQIMDVHGAGAQRSDPKSGNPGDYPQYFGPQGDVRRLLNYVRCVQGGAEFTTDTEVSSQRSTNVNPPQGGQQQATGQSQTPPQAAIDICNGKSAGSSCSFSTPQGTVTGICNQTPDGVTACIPN